VVAGAAGRQSGLPGPGDEFCAAAQSYRSACPYGRGGADGRAGSCVAPAMARGQAGAAGRGEGAGRSWTVPRYSCRSECFRGCTWLDTMQPGCPAWRCC
jgi:hypothetical protein